jgi:hypothetical protein
MRMIVLLIFALLTLPAFAQGWERYDNVPFGYSVDIPPDFFVQSESEADDGRTYAARGKPSYLIIWGGYLMGDFDSDVARRMAWDEDEAWTITDQTTTPRWAIWSALKGSRLLYQRMIQLCDGASYAAFRAEYSVTDATTMDAAVERMARSLRGDC